MKRKGQGLSLNTIIIAILVVIVLGTLIVIYINSVNDSRGKIEEKRLCGEGYSGKCAVDENACDAGYRAVANPPASGFADCTTAQPICCAKTTS